ncbi:hypothetical protein AB0O91_16895 [Kitasatospora sp. NPDC089797]|uniref:hypothetical protein n=1 Tax=Kitasatospora sp. NPDC089797 TaxID=3155298 RepID=UPI003424AA63
MTPRQLGGPPGPPGASVRVDDTAPDDDPVAPGRGCGVEVRGRAEVPAVEVLPTAPGRFGQDIVRVHPRRIVTRNLETPGSSARHVG